MPGGAHSHEIDDVNGLMAAFGAVGARIDAVDNRLTAHINDSPDPGPGPDPDPDPGPDPDPDPTPTLKPWLAPFKAAADLNTKAWYSVVDHQAVNLAPIRGWSGNLVANAARWAVPFFFTDESMPSRDVRIDHNNQWTPDQTVRIPFWNPAARPAIGSTPNDPNADANLVMVMPNRRTFYSFYGAEIDGSGQVYRASICCLGDFISGSAYLNTDRWAHHIDPAKQYPWFSRASGVFPGFGRPFEEHLLSGESMEMALTIGLGGSLLGGPDGPPGARSDFVFPAHSTDGRAVETYGGWTPMGTRLTLDQWINPSTLETPAGRCVAATFYVHGGVVSELAGSNQVTIFGGPEVDDLLNDAATRRDYAKIAPRIRRIA